MTVCRYCPLELYSGDLARVRAAVRALLQTPQNNARIFVGGRLIFGYQCHAADAGGGTRSDLAVLSQELEGTSSVFSPPCPTAPSQNTAEAEAGERGYRRSPPLLANQQPRKRGADAALAVEEGAERIPAAEPAIDTLVRLVATALTDSPVLQNLLAIQRGAPSELDAVEAAYCRVIAAGHASHITGTSTPTSTAAAPALLPTVITNGSGDVWDAWVKAIASSMPLPASAFPPGSRRGGSEEAVPAGPCPTRLVTAHSAAAPSAAPSAALEPSPSLTPLPPVPSLLVPPPAPPSSALEADIALVRRWLIGLTAKDASIMITFAPSSSNAGVDTTTLALPPKDQAGARLGVPSPSRSRYKSRAVVDCVHLNTTVGVVDLDLKPAAKIVDYAATEKRLIALHHATIAASSTGSGGEEAVLAQPALRRRACGRTEKDQTHA